MHCRNRLKKKKERKEREIKREKGCGKGVHNDLWNSYKYKYINKHDQTKLQEKEEKGWKKKETVPPEVLEARTISQKRKQGAQCSCNNQKKKKLRTEMNSLFPIGPTQIHSRSQVIHLKRTHKFHQLTSLSAKRVVFHQYGFPVLSTKKINPLGKY